jgi:hypothetical protein
LSPTALRAAAKDDLNWLVSDRVANNTLLSAISIFNVQGDLVATALRHRPARPMSPLPSISGPRNRR